MHDEILGLCSHCFRNQLPHHKKKKGKNNPDDSEGSEGSTAKRADSTNNNMSAENDDKMTNSDEYDLILSRTPHILMLIAHKKK
jgi:hypothetical protein